MRDALLGDRPALVRLFVENGLDFGRFLTWGQLENLYAGAPEVSLLRQLLDRRLPMSPELPVPSELPLLERSLLECYLPEVAHILHELLGDICAPFYAGLSLGHKGKGVGCGGIPILCVRVCACVCMCVRTCMHAHACWDQHVDQ